MNPARYTSVNTNGMDYSSTIDRNNLLIEQSKPGDPIALMSKVGFFPGMGVPRYVDYSTVQRCYGDSTTMTILGSASRDPWVYICNRGGGLISYEFPNIPSGTYKLIMLQQEDKWTEFPKANNGRAFGVWLEGRMVDIQVELDPSSLAEYLWRNRIEANWNRFHLL